MPNTIRFRFAEAADLTAATDMIRHSFPGPTRTADWRDEQLRTPVWGGGAETLFIGEVSRGMVAAVQAHPLRQYIGGRELACTGIGTVSIAPTHRRRGLGAALMRACLHACRERGDVVSALYPFRTSFYRRLGYGIAGRVEQYQVEPAMLADAPERERIELLDTDALRAEAFALYDRWMRTQNGQLVRPPALWNSLAAGQDRALFGWRAGSGELEGYAIVEYRVEPRYLDVDEIVWLNDVARRGLYGWLASTGDQWPLLTLRALPSHRLHNWIEEPRLPRGAAPSWRLWAPAATLLLGTMFRVLDVERAFHARNVGGDVDVTLDVTDPVIGENAGCWRLIGENGVARIERSTTSHPTVRLDISALSRLYIGALTATPARAAGLLECDDVNALNALDRALALPEPWTFDRF